MPYRSSLQAVELKPVPKSLHWSLAVTAEPPIYRQAALGDNAPK